MGQQEGQQRRRTVRVGSILVVAAVAAVLGATLFAPPATAAPGDGGPDAVQIPQEAQIASVHVERGTPQQVSAQQELTRAQAAGVSGAMAAQIAASTSCWYWDTQVYYKNVFGSVILRFHVEPNWCTTGYWLVSPVYTNTWANVNVPGWSYTHTGGWTKYGAGWNIYITHQNGHFCFVSYFGCVQNKYPWIEDEVGPGSATDYFRYGT